METEKQFADSKSYRAAQKGIQHQGIENAAYEGIKNIGVILDFDDNLGEVTEKRLREVLKSLMVIRQKNRTIQEHNP
jgi:hypothetical protein